MPVKDQNMDTRLSAPGCSIAPTTEQTHPLNNNPSCFQDCPALDGYVRLTFFEGSDC